MTDGNIGLFDMLVGGERLDEILHRLLGLRDNYQSRRILIKPMNDTGTGDAAYPRQIWAMVKERVNQGSRKMAGSRMDHHTRSLVHDKHIGIFVNDIQRYVLGLRRRRNGRRNFHFNDIGLGDLHPGFLGDDGIDLHKTALDKALDARARKIRISVQKNFIKTRHSTARSTSRILSSCR